MTKIITKNNKKIIMIIGSGHVGSTLLDKTLGSHSKCFSLGEIVNFSNELKREKTLCGCGAWLKDCLFWNNIINKIESSKKISFRNKPDNFQTKFHLSYRDVISHKFFLFLSMLLFGKKYKVNNISEIISNTNELYQTVFQESKADVLIDSSKNLLRALILESNIKKFDFFLCILLEMAGEFYILI